MLSIDYSNLTLSVGDLPTYGRAKHALADSGTIKINWWQNRYKKARFDDQLMLVIYCPELHATDGFCGGTSRADLGSTFKFNSRFIGKALEIYVSMTSFDRRKISIVFICGA